MFRYVSILVFIYWADLWPHKQIHPSWRHPMNAGIYSLPKCNYRNLLKCTALFHSSLHSGPMQCFGFTEAVIRLVISALVGVATVAVLVEHFRSRRVQQEKHKRQLFNDAKSVLTRWLLLNCLLSHLFTPTGVFPLPSGSRDASTFCSQWILFIEEATRDLPKNDITVCDFV